MSLLAVSVFLAMETLQFYMLFISICKSLLDSIKFNLLMTTGKSGIFQTPFGVIESTHTKRDRLSLAGNYQARRDAYSDGK